jgi:hypothetical protein
MTMEYIGALKFPAQEYDLSSISDNKRAASDAAAMMPYIRMSALFLLENDEDLEAKIRASGLGGYVDLLEGIGAALDAKRQDCEMLEAGFTRLLVVMERMIGEAEITKPKSKPTDHEVCQQLLACRARLFNRKGSGAFKPLLVTGGQQRRRSHISTSRRPAGFRSM